MINELSWHTRAKTDPIELVRGESDQFDACHPPWCSASPFYARCSPFKVRSNPNSSGNPSFVLKAKLNNNWTGRRWHSAGFQHWAEGQLAGEERSAGRWSLPRAVTLQGKYSRSISRRMAKVAHRGQSNDKISHPFKATSHSGEK